MSGRKSLPTVRVNEKEPCRSAQDNSKEEGESSHLSSHHAESADWGRIHNKNQKREFNAFYL